MSFMMVLLMAWAQTATPQADPFVEKAALTCGGDVERWEALASFFELASDQTIAEYRPGFVLTQCLADAVEGRGRLIALIDAGDRIVQVARRIAVQKAMRRDAARFGNVPLVPLKAGKAVPPEHAGQVERVLITGGAVDLLSDRKRATALLRAFSELSVPGGLLGIIDVPAPGGIDAEKLSAIAREAGWLPAGLTSTDSPKLLLLKFRKD